MKRNPRRYARAFTLIEVLVSIAILSIGIVAVMGAMGSIVRSQGRMKTQEVMQRLAERKFEEMLVTTQDLTSPQNGDFSDWNEYNYNWSTTVDTTSSTYVSAITLTVQPVNADSPKVSVVQLIYIPPQTGSTTTTGATQ